MKPCVRWHGINMSITWLFYYILWNNEKRTDLVEICLVPTVLMWLCVCVACILGGAVKNIPRGVILVYSRIESIQAAHLTQLLLHATLLRAVEFQNAPDDVGSYRSKYGYTFNV